jgi:hypothetical protein
MEYVQKHCLSLASEVMFFELIPELLIGPVQSDMLSSFE